MKLENQIKNLWFYLLIVFLGTSQTAFGQTSEEIAKNIEKRLCIPGSYHFHHCTCNVWDFSLPEFGAPRPQYHVPKRPQDILWHHFAKSIVKATGLYWSVNRNWERATTLRHNVDADYQICHLGDYVNAIHSLRAIFRERFAKRIAEFKKEYPKPHQAETLSERISLENRYFNNSMRYLNQLSLEIIPLYQDVVASLSNEAQDSLAAHYNSGLLQLQKGNHVTALANIDRFIELADRPAYRPLLNSHVFQIQGECHFEVGQYHCAIEALTMAIRHDPENKAAYFDRAAAYFEAGQFDQSLKDFLASTSRERSYDFKPVSDSYLEAFTVSLSRGSIESLQEFVPNLCHTTFGLGRVMWSCISDPIQSAKEFACACAEAGEWFVEYCQTLDRDKIETYIEELKTLYTKYDELSDGEKGELVGYAVGKYGTDIFTGAVLVEGVVAVKGVDKAKKVRELNRACTMEAMAASPAAEQKIVQAALEHTAQREAYFQEVKLHLDSHNKHVPGHPFYTDSRRSIITHPNPEELLKKGAGTGTFKQGIPGEPGFRETVDFGEVIGIWKSRTGELELPTTRGTIHYRKDGQAHIVPARPASELSK